MSNHSDVFLRYRSGLTFIRTCAIFLGVFTSLTVLLSDTAFAGAMDWLTHKRPEARTSAAPKIVPEKGGTAADLPTFFKSEAAPDITGNSLPLIKFVESHWVNARKNLELVTKSIAGKIPARRCTDISEKLFAIDMQIVKECLKNSASGIEKLTAAAKNLQALTEELNRIVTAPREETMENLEKSIERIRVSNEQLFKLAKAITSGSDSLIKISGETYQTLELIPLLSISPIDFYVQGSKQIMKQVRSDNEALKGMLLNVQSSCEQTLSGVELMVSTLKSTLRYSDHFAFKQYPLINLPVPSREKLFSQLGALQNVVKGVDNTLSIGNSHVKNSAQQFSHGFDGLTAKIRDSLQYLTAVDVSAGNLPQISVYAQNQISGLYQRTKDGLAEMKMDIAKVTRSSTMGGAPQVTLETGDDTMSRRASAVADSRLPLFLLGGKPETGKAAPVARNQGAVRSPSPEVTVLFSEKKSAEPLPGGFRSEEMDILQKELGPNTPVMRSSVPKPMLSEGDLLDLPRGARSNENEMLQSFNPMPSFPAGRLGDAREDGDQMAKSEFDPSLDKSELEMLPIDSSATQESGDLIPMLRMDDPLSAPDKE